MNSKFSALVCLGLLTSMGLMTGCGQGFSAAGTAGSNSSSSVGGGSNSSPAADQAFKAMQVDGTVTGGNDTSTQTIEIDKTNKMLIARMPVPLGSILSGVAAVVPIKEIPGATLGVENGAGGSAIVLRIPLAALLKGVDILPSTRLPNGDPLPAIPDGELPSVAVQLSKIAGLTIKPTIYLAPSVIALYLESPFDPYLALTLPIQNSSKTRTWGYLSSVPVKGAYKGGFFMSLKLPDDLARIIDDVL